MPFFVTRKIVVTNNCIRLSYPQFYSLSECNGHIKAVFQQQIITEKRQTTVGLECSNETSAASFAAAEFIHNRKKRWKN